MGFVKCPIPEVVYHLTNRKNADAILLDEKIRRYEDDCSWFCRSIPELLEYMECTVLCEGKPYYKTDGSLGFYPPFVPDDHVVLKLTPRYREGNWYRWKEQLPLNSSPALCKAAEKFSNLKIGFRGDLRFKESEVLEVAELLEQAQTEPDTEQDFEQKM